MNILTVCIEYILVDVQMTETHQQRSTYAYCSQCTVTIKCIYLPLSHTLKKWDLLADAVKYFCCCSIPFLLVACSYYTHTLSKKTTKEKKMLNKALNFIF